MQKQQFVFTHEGRSYSIAAKHLPWKGKHGDATDACLRTHAQYGDYIAFYVTCNAQSPEAGRCYCVCYFVRDRHVEYFTVN